jgi:hypothetical protein
MPQKALYLLSGLVFGDFKPETGPGAEDATFGQSTVPLVIWTA